MRPAGFEQILRFFFRPGGRISRREFVLGTLLMMCINGILLIQLLGTPEPQAGPVLASLILGLPLVVAQLVIAAKRCHDIGLPGFFVLLLFLPFLGMAWLIVLALFPGRDGPNAFGPPPRFDPD